MAPVIRPQNWKFLNTVSVLPNARTCQKNTTASTCTLQCSGNILIRLTVSMDPWKHVNQARIISAGTGAGRGKKRRGRWAQSDRSYISREEEAQGSWRGAIIRVPSHLHFVFCLFKYQVIYLSFAKLTSHINAQKLFPQSELDWFYKEFKDKQGANKKKKEVAEIREKRWTASQRVSAGENRYYKRQNRHAWPATLLLSGH